ncbi:MAG: hypothetical protein WC444_04250 [Candidatus Paceibacterota bacterium]
MKRNADLEPVLADIFCSDKSIEIKELYVKATILTEKYPGCPAEWYHGIDISGKAEIKIPSESTVSVEALLNKVFSVKIELEDKRVILLCDCLAGSCSRVCEIDKISECSIEFVARSISPAFDCGFEQLFIQREKARNSSSAVVRDSISPSKDGKSDNVTVGGPMNTATSNDSLSVFVKPSSLVQYLELWWDMTYGGMEDPVLLEFEKMLNVLYDAFPEGDKQELDSIVKLLKRRRPMDCTEKVVPFTSPFSGVTHDWFRLVKGKYKTKVGEIESVNEDQGSYNVRICASFPENCNYTFELLNADISEKDLPLKINDAVCIIEGLVDHIRDGHLTGQRSRIYMVEVKHIGSIIDEDNPANCKCGL